MIAGKKLQNPSLKELRRVHAPWGWRNIVGEDRVWKTRWTNYQATKNKELELDLRKKADVLEFHPVWAIGLRPGWEGPGFYLM